MNLYDYWNFTMYQPWSIMRHTRFTRYRNQSSLLSLFPPLPSTESLLTLVKKSQTQSFHSSWNLIHLRMGIIWVSRVVTWMLWRCRKRCLCLCWIEMCKVGHFQVIVEYARSSDTCFSKVTPIFRVVRYPAAIIHVIRQSIIVECRWNLWSRSATV